MNEACLNVAPVFDQYKEVLIRFISSRIKDPVDRDELVSEVMMKVYDNCEKLPGIRNLESWLVTISRNAIIDYHRQRGKVVLGEIPEVGEDESNTLYQSVAACIPGLIDRLPPKYGGPLFDYEMKGIPQKELAVQYQMSESGLKSRVQRGRKMLRALLLDYCGDLFEANDDCDSNSCVC